MKSKDYAEMLKEYIQVKSSIKNLEEKEKGLYESIVNFLNKENTLSCDIATATIEEEYLWFLSEDYFPQINMDELSATLKDGRKVKLQKKLIGRLKIKLLQ